MSQDEIVSIFAKYLNTTEDVAREKMLSFFDKEDMDDIELNPENSQLRPSSWHFAMMP